jgi:hypothetical protein
MGIELWSHTRWSFFTLMYHVPNNSPQDFNFLRRCFRRKSCCRVMSVDANEQTKSAQLKRINADLVESYENGVMTLQLKKQGSTKWCAGKLTPKKGKTIFCIRSYYQICNRLNKVSDRIKNYDIFYIRRCGPIYLIMQLSLS